MNNLQTIITRLKETLTSNTKQKVLDKDIASALKIKATRLASLKSRDNPPYQAILTYCHENRLDVRKLLFNDVSTDINYPRAVKDGKVQIRYFRTLEAYATYLSFTNSKKYISQSLNMI